VTTLPLPGMTRWRAGCCWARCWSPVAAAPCLRFLQCNAAGPAMMSCHWEPQCQRPCAVWWTAAEAPTAVAVTPATAMLTCLPTFSAMLSTWS
jgi:hypothetical protein